MPRDRRVPFTPEQCVQLMQAYPGLQITVQPSPWRAFSDQEYIEKGVLISEDVTGCDVLIGIKEVPKTDLIPGKTYQIGRAHV